MLLLIYLLLVLLYISLGTIIAKFLSLLETTQGFCLALQLHKRQALNDIGVAVVGRQLQAEVGSFYRLLVHVYAQLQGCKFGKIERCVCSADICSVGKIVERLLVLVHSHLTLVAVALPYISVS